MIPFAAFNRQTASAGKGPGERPLRPVFGLLGDAFLQDQVLQQILDWTLPAEDRQMNCETLSGETTSLVAFSTACTSLPFFADRRVLILKRAERLDGMGRAAGDTTEGTSKGKRGKQSTSRFAEIIQTLPATTTLILCRTAETPEPGTRPATRCISAPADNAIEAGSTALGPGVLVDCTIGPKQTGLVIAALNKVVTERGYSIAPNVLHLLVERGGHDILHLQSELEKCALRAGAGPITEAIVEEMTRRVPQDTIYNLTDAVADRNATRALHLLEELLDQGEAPARVLSLLVRQFRLLLQARALLGAGLPLNGSAMKRLPTSLADLLPQNQNDNLPAILQQAEWRTRQLPAQAKRFTEQQLQNGLEEALSTDLAMKGIEGEGRDERGLLESLIVRLC